MDDGRKFCLYWKEGGRCKSFDAPNQGHSLCIGIKGCDSKEPNTKKIMEIFSTKKSNCKMRKCREVYLNAKI